jgi:SynChlorMet cassette radical SAM/SPASM protein ScmF
MELSTAEITDIIDQALPLGLTSIKITGGEPFLRDDIVEIVGYADAQGIGIRIESNAMLLDEDTARALGRFEKLNHVAVSLDGASAESHALLRGGNGAFEKTVQGIEWLVSSGVKVLVITCLHRNNYHEIEDVISLTAQLGASGIKINPIIGIGRGGDMSARGELASLQDILELNRRIDTGLEEEYGVSVLLDIPLAFRSLGALRRGRTSGCAVTNLLGVLPNGDVSICGVGEQHPDLIFGHARKLSIRQIWESSPALMSVREQIAAWPSGLCQSCLVRKYCPLGHCRAEAYAVLGSLAAPVPFCQVAFEAGLFPPERLLA